MAIKRCHQLALGILALLALGTVFTFVVGMRNSNAKIIDSVTKNPKKAELGKGGLACQQLTAISTVTRNGQQVFKHLVGRCGERSEMATKKTEIGKTYWYGWSMFIPTAWKDSDAGFDIVNQFGAYPGKPGRKFPCRGIGSMISREGSNFNFIFQRQGTSIDSKCTRHTLFKVSEVRGKWIDFVMNVKWTGNKDGFLKLWTKVGNGPYVQKLNMKGATFWNDEGTGPYFKMGLYKGDPNFKGPAPRYLYTAEYRLGDANSNFRQVAPRLAKRIIAD
jgi:hypothetical protein